MNPGYLALISIWFMILLSWTGIFDRFLEKHQLKKRWLYGFLFFSLLGIGFTFQLPGHGEISPISFVLPLIIGVHLWVQEGDANRMHILTASFLIGTSIFLLRLLLQMDPILMVLKEKYMIALLILFLCLVAARGVIQHLILLVFGMTLGEIGFQYYLWVKTGTYQLGSYRYSDLWWLILTSLLVINGIFTKLMFKFPFSLRRKGAETS